jgi:hypothetical protein
LRRPRPARRRSVPTAPEVSSIRSPASTSEQLRVCRPVAGIVSPCARWEIIRAHRPTGSQIGQRCPLDAR